MHFVRRAIVTYRLLPSQGSDRLRADHALTQLARKRSKTGDRTLIGMNYGVAVTPADTRSCTPPSS